MSTTASWVEQMTGRAVIEVSPLLGGMSARVERCDLDDGSSIVVRAITDTEWLRREPDLIANEARALVLAAGSAVRTPELVAADPAEARLAMSFVAGSMAVDNGELGERADTMAAAAAAIAATPLPPRHDLPLWRSWAPADPEPPDWGDPELWRQGIDAYLSSDQPLVESPSLLHRDLHPLNMLWSTAEDIAIVDWVNACVGHPHAELGHLRWNLSVLADIDLADRVLESYLSITTGPARAIYDPWWDIAPLMSFLGGPIGLLGYHSVGRTDLTPELVVQRTEAFLAAALRQR